MGDIQHRDTPTPYRLVPGYLEGHLAIASGLQIKACEWILPGPSSIPDTLAISNDIRLNRAVSHHAPHPGLQTLCSCPSHCPVQFVCTPSSLLTISFQILTAVPACSPGLSSLLGSLHCYSHFLIFFAVPPSLLLLDGCRLTARKHPVLLYTINSYFSIFRLVPKEKSCLSAQEYRLFYMYGWKYVNSVATCLFLTGPGCQVCVFCVS